MSNNIILGFVQSTPPITRVLVSAVMATTLLVYLNVLSPNQLTYSRYYLPRLQIHRGLTTFLYFGQINLEVALHILFLFRYSAMLEESCARTSDYFFMLLVIMGMLFLLSNIYYIPLLGPSLSCTITYIWTRRHPQTIVQIMGFVSFYAFYLPFIMPLFTLIFEGKVSMDEIVGIIVGHVIYFLRDVYPHIGSAFLRTPCWCHRLFNERGECCEAGSGERKKKRLRDLPRAAGGGESGQDGSAAGAPDSARSGEADREARSPAPEPLCAVPVSFPVSAEEPAEEGEEAWEQIEMEEEANPMEEEEPEAGATESKAEDRPEERARGEDPGSENEFSLSTDVDEFEEIGLSEEEAGGPASKRADEAAAEAADEPGSDESDAWASEEFNQ